MIPAQTLNAHHAMIGTDQFDTQHHRTMNQPAEEQPNPATIARFPQHPAPPPDQAPPRLPSPLEDEMRQEGRP